MWTQWKDQGHEDITSALGHVDGIAKGYDKRRLIKRLFCVDRFEHFFFTDYKKILIPINLISVWNTTKVFCLLEIFKFSLKLKLKKASKDFSFFNA